MMSVIVHLKESFIEKNILYLYALFIVNISLIYFYNNRQKIGNDVLNKVFIGNISLWHLVHSFVYLFICFIWNISSLYDYINILIMMGFWYLFELSCYKVNNKLNIININKNVINKGGGYKNPYVPEYIDFVFNLIGVMMYIIYPKILL